MAKQCVEDNSLITYKCQRPILGVSGPEILKRKIKIHINPWLDNDISSAVEMFVLNSLDGLYPYCKIEASKQEIKHLVLADENFDEPAPVDALLGADVYAQIISNELYRHKHGAIMQSTSFGHIILGKFKIMKNEILPMLNIRQND